MADGPRVLIIGGVACGPKTACRLKRLIPDAEVTVIEKASIVSYGACGLPYFVEGLFSDLDILIETPVGTPRTPVFFEKAKGFKVLTRTEAVTIDRGRKRVGVRFLDDDREEELPYDKLVLATGGQPIHPPVPGLDLDNIWHIRRPDDVADLVESLEQQGLKRAALIGAGYIGMEMAEALLEKGLEVAVVEMYDQVMPAFLDTEMSMLVGKHMKSKGVELHLGKKVTAIEGTDGRVRGVATDSGRIEADAVILAVGIRPNDELAREAGLDCHHRGGVEINHYCQTSDPNIYAGGDCVVNHYVHPIAGSLPYAPLGSTANKHGRVIANHIAGLISPFSGVSGTGICKVFDYTVARTGMTEKMAKDMSLDVESAIWAGADLPHYYPKVKPLVIKLVTTKRYRKLLGFQAVGLGEVSKRLDVAASAVFFDATLDQIGNIDLGYAPPYSPPIDPLATAAHVLLNKLNGLALGISPLEAKDRMDRDGDGVVLLDVRTPEEFEQMRLPDPRVVHIPIGELRERASELPRDKDILAFCKVSMRGYEAQRILEAKGFDRDRLRFIEGGLIGWPYEVWTPS